MDCWICGAPATSGEHKVKKSLLVALHGAGPYTSESALLHIKEGAISSLQGPGSDRIKYRNTLCQACNTARTQPFDNAFDQFYAFILENEEAIVRRRMIDFADVYGGTFAAGQRNLYKYFVKLLGCDLHDGGFPVPPDLVALLDQEQFKTGLRITFAISEDTLDWPKASQRPVGIGNLQTTARNLESKDEPQYRWDVYFSFIRIFFWYSMYVTGPLGAPWVADSQYLYLGSCASFAGEHRLSLSMLEGTDSLMSGSRRRSK